VYQQQQQQQQQEQEQDAENPFLDPPFSRIKIRSLLCSGYYEVNSQYSARPEANFHLLFRDKSLHGSLPFWNDSSFPIGITAAKD
jgi:hypothetical protein